MFCMEPDWRGDQNGFNRACIQRAREVPVSLGPAQLAAQPLDSAWLGVDQGGYAQDTGRAGPTWTFHTDEHPDGVYCTGKGSGCVNHPSNQYQLNAYDSGWYRACGRNGACGSFFLER